MVSRYNGNMYYKHGTDEKLKELRSKKALIDDDKYTRTTLQYLLKEKAYAIYKSDHEIISQLIIKLEAEY